MTSSLPPTASLSNPADRSHGQDNIWRESASLHSMENPTSCLDDSLRFFFLPPFFLLKTIMAEQNLQSWSLDTSPPSSEIASFSDKNTFPFYWHLPLELLAYEQRAAEPRFGNNGI